MKPHEFIASVKDKARALAATQAAAAAAQAAAAAAEEPEFNARETPDAPADEEFAQAIWFAAIDKTHREPNGPSAGSRIARIIGRGTADGLTDGQLAALEQLAKRVNKGDRMLEEAARNSERRPAGQPWSRL
jgi:hypothetical protein